MTSTQRSEIEQLPNELIEHVFAHAGPIDTAHCSLVCKKFHSVSKNSAKLWRTFLQRDFRGCDDSDEVCDWKAIYGYLSQKQQRFNFSLQHPLRGRVRFADDGTHLPGHPPEIALRRGQERPYSTGVGVISNVDLVIDLSEVCLVTGFAAANHCVGCSGPLKEALVFTSLNPPDLDHARMYDGEEGSKWVTELEEQVKQKKDAYPKDGKTNREGTVHFTPDNDTQPVAGLRLPEYPDCYTERIIRHCKPVVGRYIHFKLLSIFDPQELGNTNNIDVMDLHTFGIALPELPGMLQRESLRSDGRHFPNYQRIHEPREPNHNALPAPMFFGLLERPDPDWDPGEIAWGSDDSESASWNDNSDSDFET